MIPIKSWIAIRETPPRRFRIAAITIPRVQDRTVTTTSEADEVGS